VRLDCSVVEERQAASGRPWWQCYLTIGLKERGGGGMVWLRAGGCAGRQPLRYSESGHDPADWQKAAEAFGFIVTAVKLRSSDAANAAWVPIEAILRSRTLSNLFVFLPTGAAAYLVLRHEGTLGLVKAAESIFAIGVVLYGLIHTGRWWRNVKPPQPKARRPEVSEQRACHRHRPTRAAEDSGNVDAD
jgi:hypothetical protein